MVRRGRSESKNARKGIKTYIVTNHQCCDVIEMSESKNARKGIKTQSAFDEQSWFGFKSESKNARKGIKTGRLVALGYDYQDYMSESKNARKGIKT